jgi:small GTP-binding protein
MSDTTITTDADSLQRARESLEQTIAELQLTPTEQAAVADELKQLHDLAAKLDANTIEIAAFGMVSRGKSSVLNALCGKEVFKVGATHGTTVSRNAHPWETATITGSNLDGANLVLVDTPGIDEVGGEVRETLAREVARHADLILFVISGDMQRREYESLSELRDAQKPILLVFNQIDRYPDADRDSIHRAIVDERVKDLVRPEDVVLTAARPDPFKVKIRHPDGSTTVEWERPSPTIEPLKLRILEVLEREGKALVALNAMLFAGDVHRDIIAHKMRIRDDTANRTIWNFAIAKGAAVGLNPIPVADMAGGLVVDIGMIVALSRIYGIPLNRQNASGLIKDMLKALGAFGAVDVATRLVAKAAQSALGGATVVTGGLALPLTLLGYGAIGVTLGATGATTSYVLGHGAKYYLEQGCGWGHRGIKTVIHEILSEAKRDSVMERLRDDLKKKVKGS